MTFHQTAQPGKVIESGNSLLQSANRYPSDKREKTPKTYSQRNTSTYTQYKYHIYISRYVGNTRGKGAIVGQEDKNVEIFLRTCLKGLLNFRSKCPKKTSQHIWPDPLLYYKMIMTAPAAMPGHLGAVSLKKYHDIVISSFCNILSKGSG